MGRYPKDEPTAKNLVCKKVLLIPEKNWENLEKPLAIGGLKLSVKVKTHLSVLSITSTFKIIL